MKFPALPLASLSFLLALSACSGNSLELVIQPDTVGRSDEYAFAKVTASGEWTLSTDAGWLQIIPRSGSGSKGDVVLSFGENISSDARNAVITLSCSGKTVTGSLTQLTTEISGSGGITGVYHSRYKGAPSWMTWMELPATDAGTDLITHYFDYRKSTLRNYSFAWSPTHCLARWVAYPLGASWSDNNNVGRTDAWAEDPVLEKDGPLPVKEGGNYCPGWTRGHQIPSFDRQCCYQANAQTFYGTNMTPQNYDFNTGIWVAAEGVVRGWAAKSDTLYVVTGCVPGSRTSTEPNGHRVSIPDKYFKAVLRYSKGSSIGYSDYAGCAMCFDHSGNYSGRSVSEYAMSIDQLESITGIDFFVNLPGKIGSDQAAKVEAQNPKSINFWF